MLQNEMGPDQVDVEWLIMADAAQVVSGKLYILGGGFSNVNIRSGWPATHKFAIAMAIKVPWIHTNEDHRFGILIQSIDGGELAKVEGAFQAGRPAGVPPGRRAAGRRARGYDGESHDQAPGSGWPRARQRRPLERYAHLPRSGATRALMSAARFSAG